MKSKWLVMGVLILLAGCSTTFLAYEGRSDLIFEGKGGARTTVDGIDFWQHGDPPRTYQLIGYIKDKRKTGLIEAITKDGNIAAKARESGGDAVMVLDSNTTITGYARSAFVTGNRRSAFASAISVPIGNSQATYAVLKYVSFGNEAGAPGAAPAQPAAPVPAPSPTATAIPMGPALTQQPANIAPSNVASPYAAPSAVSTAGRTTSAIGEYTFGAERLAKDTACADVPVARLTGKGPGLETFAITCRNGDVMNVRCDYGQCRALR